MQFLLHTSQEFKDKFPVVSIFCREQNIEHPKRLIKLFLSVDGRKLKSGFSWIVTGTTSKFLQLSSF